jgi:hypothetical protein
MEDSVDTSNIVSASLGTSTRRPNNMWCFKAARFPMVQRMSCARAQFARSGRTHHHLSCLRMVFWSRCALRTLCTVHVCMWILTLCDICVCTLKKLMHIHKDKEVNERGVETSCMGSHVHHFTIAWLLISRSGPAKICFFSYHCFLRCCRECSHVREKRVCCMHLSTRKQK